MPRIAGPRGALLCFCILAAGPAVAGEGESPSGGAGEIPNGDEPLEEPAEDAGTPDSESPFEKIWKDPTLGGKVHFTQRLGYTLRIHDFKRYEFPFPDSITDDDREQARQLEEMRDNRTDQDMENYFSLRADDIYASDSRKGLLGSAGGEASFRWWKDIDGSPHSEESRGFYDNLHDNEAFQLQTLFARLKTLDQHLELELGRQFAREAEWLHFDGGTATFRGLKVLDREVELAAYGGSRVTYFPNSSSSHDGIGGGHLKAWIADETRLQLSDVHYIDNSFEAEIRQDFAAHGWAAARYRMINEDPHAVLVDASYEPSGSGLSVLFYYVGKLGRNADDFQFDYTQSERRKKDGDNIRYFNLGDIEPYDEASLEARKGLGGVFGVFAGGTLHRLRERDRKDNYNTDWQEAWGGFDLSNPFWEGLTGRATVRYIHTDLPRQRLRLPMDEVLENGIPDFLPGDTDGDGEPGSLGLELLLEQDIFRKVAVGGTAVLRSYDIRSNYAEIQNLRASSLGTHVRWQLTPVVDWVLRYQYDTDYRYVNPDLEALHTVRTQVILRW